MDIKMMAHEIQPEIIAFRRDIHEHPEPGLKEFRTTRKVAAELDKLQIPYRLTEPTGIIAEITGTKGESSKRVLLRADMDALTIQEETGLPFASQNGFMHACGHDTHTSMLLGAAKLLTRLRDQFAGTVRLVFQPAEELGVGADMMIAQGAAKDVDLGMALHIASFLPPHVLSSKSGPWAAATDKFTIRVIGQGCHGAGPDDGADPICAAAAIISQLQTMVSREFKPIDPVVVSVCSIHGGERFNVIPDDVVMVGTCRCFHPEIWKQIPAVMERIAQNVAAALRCRAEVTFERVTKPLNCDKKAYEILDGTVRKIIQDPSQWEEAPITMGGEDFAAFGECMPIVMAHLGAGPSYPMHSSRVCFQEDAFETGVACYTQFALDALEKLNGE